VSTVLVASVLSFGVAFVAELGDKSQLLAMVLAVRHRRRTVLIGVGLATAAVHALSVVLGRGLGEVLPASWISLAAALVFLGSAVWMARSDAFEEVPAPVAHAGAVVVTVFAAFFLAELGDRTMLATITLAAQHDWLGVWVGSTLGMVAADTVAIEVGRRLGRRLPERMIRRVASLLFLVFGAWQAVEGTGQLGLPQPWWTAIASLALAACLLRFATPASRPVAPESTSTIDKGNTTR
jgi:putative Ca2+/H+ antiporter (TMEM165/GDT1 family)